MHRQFTVTLTVAFLFLFSGSSEEYGIGKSEDRNQESSSEAGAIVSQTNQLLGVLENNGKESFVRIVFERKSEGWIPVKKKMRVRSGSSFETLKEKVSWAVLYKGTNLGQVQTASTDELIAKAEGYLSVPMIEGLSNEFAGWTNDSCYRPLVVVANIHSYKPKPFSLWQPSKSERESLLARFRKIVGKTVVTCDSADLVGESYRLRVYVDSQTVMSPCITIDRSMRLTCLQLDSRLNKCGGPPEAAWSTFWFCVDPRGNIVRLSTHKNQLDYESVRLVDIGDFDADGKFEVLFWVSRYNEDGYLLFYDTFKRLAICTWKYH